ESGSLRKVRSRARIRVLVIALPFGRASARLLEPGGDKAPLLLRHARDIAWRHGVAAARLKIDLAGMRGDVRIRIEPDVLRRGVDALEAGLGRMAHGAATHHRIAHGRKMRGGDEALLGGGK